MNTKISRSVTIALLFFLTFSFSGCGYNSLQTSDEDTKATWAEVVNQYKRRSDLVPNLVSTVKGYASHEQQVLQQVTEARARVGQVQLSAEDLTNEAAVKQFAEAQASMGSALSRLLAVSENYPQLKADASFRDLQAQLEGTENRITVARNRYIESVKNYNGIVRSFPSNLTAKMFGYSTKAQFTVENEGEISQPPAVTF